MRDQSIVTIEGVKIGAVVMRARETVMALGGGGTTRIRAQIGRRGEIKRHMGAVIDFRRITADMTRISVKRLKPVRIRIIKWTGGGIGQTESLPAAQRTICRWV